MKNEVSFHILSIEYHIHVIYDYHSEIYMIIVLDYLILDYFFENKFLMNSLKIDLNELSTDLR